MINGKKCDIFISYRRSEGWELARLVYNSLKENHFNPFLDIEGINVGNDWKNKIKRNLKEASIVVLIVSRKSLSKQTLEEYAKTDEGDWVMKEVDYAMKHKKVIIPFLAEKAEYDGVTGNLKEAIGRQRVSVNPSLMEKGLDDMYKAIYEYLGKVKGGAEQVGRITCSSGIVAPDNKKAKQCRDEIQSKCYIDIDQLTDEYYSSFKKALFDVLAQYQEYSILDIGCGNAYKVLNLVQNSQKLKAYTGIDNDWNWIRALNDSFPNKPNKINFECMDATDKKFGENLLFKAAGDLVDKRYDVVIISELLTYVKDPRGVIEAAKRALKPGGTLLVADFDDGLNLYYPDPEGLAKKFDSLMSDDKEDFGNRYTGREIYTHLSNAGLADIKLHNSIITTATSKNFSERVKNFDTRYKLLSKKFKNRLEVDKYDLILNHSSNWLEEHEEKLKRIFREDNFFCSSSYLIWTAKKDKEDERTFANN